MTQCNCSSEFGVKSCMDVPNYVIVGFIYRLNSQEQNFDDFCRPTVSNTKFLIGSEKYHDVGKNLDCGKNILSPGYGRHLSCFGHITADVIFQS